MPDRNPLSPLAVSGHARPGQHSLQPGLPHGLLFLRRLPHDRAEGALPESLEGGSRKIEAAHRWAFERSLIDDDSFTRKRSHVFSICDRNPRRGLNENL